MKPRTRTMHQKPAMIALVCLAVSAQLQHQTLPSHPMQVYMSLPSGWQRGTPYLVVVAIESAEREFAPYFKKFVQARGSSPFIVAVPLVVTNGGSRYKEGPGYQYSDAVWKRIDADPWKFDDEGLQAL